jgi:FixJ family two-component response regulator/AraC-like DNA-binding protein
MDRQADPESRFSQNAAGSDAATLRSLRVLWIDDEVHPDDAAVRLLKLEGLQVECAASGSAGLALARGGCHDVIVLDLRLPDTSGLAVLERMRAEKVRAPTLILTGYADVETAVTAMRLGAVDFRKKPLFGDELVEAVHAAARHRAARDWRPDVAQELMRDLDELLQRKDEDRSRLTGVLVRAVATPDLAVPSLLAYARALRYVVADPAHTTTAELIERVRELTLPVERDTSHNSTVRAAIEALVRHVTNHVRPSEDDLAAELGIDPAHLGRLLRRETGVGFREWRRALVMRAAIRMLAGTDEHVDQIAYSVGFDHPSQFDREFRELFGLSPTRFRRLVARARTG